MQDIHEGIRLQWCHPLDERKVQEPHHNRRVKGVKCLLRGLGYNQDEATEVVEKDHLTPAAFPNRLSSAQEKEFARKEIQKNLACGAVIKWPFARSRPWVVLPLAVCTNHAGKQRLIVDGRYLNLFLQWLPFKYETVKDAVRMIIENEWMWTIDYKAGYHHLLLSQQEWAFVGLQLDGELYCHIALPFGLSQAPEAFTRVAQAALAPIRKAGVPLTSMVDDSMGAERRWGRAARGMYLHVGITGILNWTLSGQKCMRSPEREGRFLGFQFNIGSRQLTVPADKIARLQAILKRLQQAWTVDLYRSAAGTLASFAPAMPFSTLMVKALRWESEEGGEVAVLGESFWTFWQKHASTINGRSWLAGLQPAVVLVVDTSESATGAHVKGTRWSMVVQFTPGEDARMAEGGYSSTERELRGVEKSAARIDESNH